MNEEHAPADFNADGDVDRFDLRWVDAWGGDEEGSWNFNETRHVADIEVGTDEPDEAIVDKANAKLFDGGQPPEGFDWEYDGDVWELKDLETGEPKYVIVPMDY